MIGMNELVVGGLLILAIVVVVVFFALRSSDKVSQDVTFTDAIPDDDPLVIGDEFQATPIAEMVEERVRQKIADDPTLANLDVDFGTGVDGGLEIWVNDERYTSIEDLPNPVLQKVIRDAVEDYNRGL